MKLSPRSGDVLARVVIVTAAATLAGFLIEQGGKTGSPYAGFAVCAGKLTTRATFAKDPNYNPATDPWVLSIFADSHIQQYGGAPNLSDTAMACASPSNSNVYFLTTTGEEYRSDYQDPNQETTTTATTVG